MHSAAAIKGLKMAGLLDFNLDDPQQAGMMALAQGLLSAGAPQTRRVGFGEALAQGMGGMMQARQQAKGLQQQNAANDLAMKIKQLQFGGMQQDAAARQAQQAFQAQIPKIVEQFGNDYQGMIRAGVPAEYVKQLAESRNYGRDEVARTQEIEGQGGEKIIQQLSKFGDVIGAGLPGYVAPVQINRGDQISMVKPAAGLNFKMGFSPSDQIAMRGQNMTDARAREKLAAETSSGGYSTKPLPTAALKMQNDAIDAINTASGINDQLSKVANQIETGKLSFGPLSNVINSTRNTLGISSEESKNFASFKSTLEKLRNDSLRLNTGVQTDGDAQRAWNELFQNINDTGLVKQRLQEITAINKRAEELQKLKVDQIRGNYNAAPMDFNTTKSATSGSTSKVPMKGQVMDGYKFKGGNPADPNSWEKM